MTSKQPLCRPEGGVDERKYALAVYTIALLRGYIDDVAAIPGDAAFVRHVQATTSLANMAASCGYSEGELAIDWSYFLSETEKEAVRCGAG